MDGFLPSDDAIRQASAIIVDSIKRQNSLTAEGKSVRSQLETEVQVFDSAAIAIYEYLDREAARLKRQLNTHAPVHKLPNEILTNILLFEIRRRADRRYPTRSSSRRHELASVCHYWVQVFRNTPLLWTDISRGDPDWEVALRKSQDAPLHVRSVSSDLPLYGLPIAMGGFLKRLGPSVSRWQSVCMETEEKESLTALQQCLGNATSCLKTIIIHNAARLFPIAINLDVAAQASLRHVSLNQVDIPWGLSDLRSLELFGVDQAPTLAQFKQMISSSLQLENLTLFECWPVAPSDEEASLTEPIVMPLLHSLHLEQTSGSLQTYIVTAIRSPVLKSLRFEGLQLLDDAKIADGLLELAKPVFRWHSAFQLGNYGEKVYVGVKELKDARPPLPSSLHPADQPELRILLKATDPTDLLTAFAHYISASESPAKLHLHLSGAYAGHKKPTGCCPTDVLDSLPNIRSLSISCQSGAEAIVRHLREASIADDGSTRNPCPNLEELDLRAVKISPITVDTLQAKRIKRIAKILPSTGLPTLLSHFDDLMEQAADEEFVDGPQW